MLYITSKEKIKEYRESNSIGQSQLKKLLVGMDEFLKEDDFKQTLSIQIGKAVDTILTGNEEDFEDEFYISSYPKPSDTVALILETVYEKAIDKRADLETYEGILAQVIIDMEYQKNWKIDTRINKLLEFSGYYQELQDSDGKIIITEETKTIIDNVVDSLRSNPVTQQYFNRVTPNNMDIYLQLPIYWEYKNVQCKSLLDIVVVLKENNGDIRNVIPVDLKTMWDKTTNFLISVKARRYDIQAASYSLAVAKHFNIPMDKVDEFLFVVESTTDIGRPLVFQCTKELLNVGLNGLPELKYEQRVIRDKILGYNDLIDLYIYYSKQGWLEEKIIFENNGKLRLTWNKLLGYGD